MYSDIEEARSHHAALRDLVARHPGSADYRALRRALQLCRSAAEAIDDRYCGDKLRVIEDFAAEMFSRGEERTPFLKQRILDALELYHSRLYSLESLRRAAARAAQAISPAALRT